MHIARVRHLCLLEAEGMCLKAKSRQDSKAGQSVDKEITTGPMPIFCPATLYHFRISGFEPIGEASGAKNDHNKWAGVSTGG